MTEKKENPVIIFSGYTKAANDELNRVRHNICLVSLENAGAKPIELKGYYKGLVEKSILVLDSPELRKIVLNLATYFDQESILLLDQDRNAALLFLGDNSQQEIGRFIPVSKDKIDNLDAWVYNPTTKKYYSVVQV